MKADRRTLLKYAAATAAGAVAGCRWDSVTASRSGAPLENGADPTAPTAPTPPPADAAWVPDVPSMTVGSGTSFDLNSTLPARVARGGAFGVDASGARLPSGMILSAAGLLSVGSAARGTVAGVIFTYDAP